jgi:hypothetical protein
VSYNGVEGVHLTSGIEPPTQKFFFSVMGPKPVVDGSLDAKKCPTHVFGWVGPKKKIFFFLAKNRFGWVWNPGSSPGTRVFSLLDRF